MTRDEFEKLVDDLVSGSRELSRKKAKDYATEDVLSNFKRISSICKAMNVDIKTSYGYAILMILLKLDRINNIMSKSAIPENESIDDSVRDCFNYLMLMNACIKEK